MSSNTIMYLQRNKRYGITLQGYSADFGRVLDLNAVGFK
jgi:hypothetical protein